MFKRDVKETIEYYDENGNLTKREIKEEHSEDDTVYKPSDIPTISPWNTYGYEPTCTITTTATNSEE